MFGAARASFSASGSSSNNNNHPANASLGGNGNGNGNSGLSSFYDNHAFSLSRTAGDGRESFRVMESMADYVSYSNDTPGQLPYLEGQPAAAAGYDNETDLDEESFRSDLERDSAHSSLVQGRGAQHPLQQHPPPLARSLSHNQRHEMLLREANRRASLQAGNAIRTSLSRQPLMETSFEAINDCHMELEEQQQQQGDEEVTSYENTPSGAEASTTPHYTSTVNPNEIALSIPADSEAERQGIGRVIERPRTAMGRKEVERRRSASEERKKKLSSGSATSQPVAVISPSSHEEIQPAPEIQRGAGAGRQSTRGRGRGRERPEPLKPRSYKSPSRRQHLEVGRPQQQQQQRQRGPRPGADGGIYQKPQKPRACLSNLFGLIDTGKLEAVLGGPPPDMRIPQLPPSGAEFELGARVGRRASASGAERVELEAAMSPEERAAEARERYREVIRETEKHRGRQDALFYGSVFGFLGGVLLLMSFASPYWLVSWEDTQSPFKNMGLWEFCFYKFRHPDYQFDHLFTGCHALYGDEYRLIREKLLPGWLMVVQFFVTVALIFTFVAQLVQVALLLRAPLEVILRFEYHFCGVSFLLHAATAALLFLGVLVFGCCCWARDWLLYPNYNYVSWSYAFAVISCLVHIFAALFMLKDYKDARERKERNKALIVQMHPPGFSSNYHLGGGSGYI